MAKAESECLFLDMLPAEMRNNIYELVYVNDTSEDNEIDLLAAEAPSNALILACRQIHDEAAKIHNSSYREFWSKSSFALHTRTYNEYEGHLKRFCSQDLQQITRFTLRTCTIRGILVDFPGHHTHELVCPNGWRSYTEIGGDKRDFGYRKFYADSFYDYPLWREFDSLQDMVVWHPPLESPVDLVYQIKYLVETRTNRGRLV